MKQPLLRCAGFGVASVVAALVAIPAASAVAAPPVPAAHAPAPAATPASSTSTASASSTEATSTTTATCPLPALFQPFSGDSRFYALAPGESANSFNGTGWILTGGAKIVTQTLADGTVGTVLDLPAGATAKSPPMCVDSTYPLARMQTRTLGKAPDNSTKFYTVPVATGTPSGGMPVLGTTSWATSPPDNVAAANTAAEQVQFEFVAGRNAADLQVYNLYIDPSMRKC